MTSVEFDASAAAKHRMHANIRRWYQQHGRRLPWRETADPYRVWISEIMLQQTTTVTVVPYFERFLDRFPNVHVLASADQSEVLRLWEGLGYYSRARNLHQAARSIVDQYGGQFPRSVSELMSLPGIGRYTAGAILSFAFDLPAPILEANTRRLFSRLMGLDIDPSSAIGQRQLWGFAEWIAIPSGRRPVMSAGDLNQAVMDLGSAVCRPAAPRCDDCPLVAECVAFRTGRQQQIPVEKVRPQVTAVTEVSVALRRGPQVLLRQRTAAERWTGLWDFVRFEVNDADAGQLSSGGAGPVNQHLPVAWTRTIEEQTGLRVTRASLCEEIRHSVTRYRIRLLCLEALQVTGRLRPGSDYQWFSTGQLTDLPLSKTGRQFATLLLRARQRQDTRG